MSYSENIFFSFKKMEKKNEWFTLKSMASKLRLLLLRKKAKHVFSGSHGKSLGFHANWQVCFLFVHFSFSLSFSLFSTQTFFLSHCICTLYLFISWLLFTLLFIVPSMRVCVCLCADARDSPRLFLISLYFTLLLSLLQIIIYLFIYDLQKVKTAKLWSVESFSQNEFCADSCDICVNTCMQ